MQALVTKVALPLKVAPTTKRSPKLTECQDRVLAEAQPSISHARRIEYSQYDSIAAHSVWRAGNALFVAAPNEACMTTVQTELHGAYADEAVIVMNVADDTISFLPPAPLRLTANYAVWQTLYDRGGLENLIEGAKNGLKV